MSLHMKPSITLKPMKYLLVLWLALVGSIGYSQPLYRTQVKDVEALKARLTYDIDHKPLVSAHRGGPYPGYPENCIATFEHVLKYTPALIECDVRMTQDSVLIMMHDETLNRTTSGSGKISERRWEDIRSLDLLDNERIRTTYHIPTFAEVLHWAVGKAILTVDVKSDVPYQKVVKAIEAAYAEAYVVVITYNAEDAREVHRLHPELMISLTIRNKAELQRAVNTSIPLENLVAFVGITEPPLPFYKILHSKGISCILGTMGNLDKSALARGDQLYARLVKHGADILSTDRPIEVAAALEEIYVEQKD